MSSILLTWLNTEVDLSKKVTNMEKDFANGYLLGELLHKFNQLTNLSDFRDEDNRSAMMNNFKILHGVLRNVGVKFDSNTAKNIMDSKPGFIANLLYEIRSNLEKKGVNPENISLKKSSHFQEMYAPMKFRQEIPQYDAFDSKHFYETLQRKTRAQKEVDLENKLKRFEDFKIEQDKKIRQAIAEEEYRLEQEKAINIRNHRNKNQRYHAFLQQFEEKGINNWKNNMLRAKQREIKDVQFQLNEAQKIQKNLYRGIARNVAIYHHEIKQFEENFGKNGKKISDLTTGKKEENEKKGESNENQKPEEEKKQEDESIHIDINSRYNKTFYSIFNTGDTTCTKLDQILDECEFYEYQNNKGQWDPKIIPETAFISLKPDDLAFNYTQPITNQEQNKKDKGGKNVNAGKGGNEKAKPENIEEMMKLEDPNDLIIPKENIKNCLFGDLIGILIDLKYEGEKKKRRRGREKKN